MLYVGHSELRDGQNLGGLTEHRGTSRGEVLRNNAVVLLLAGNCPVGAEVKVFAADRGHGLAGRLVLAVLGERIRQLWHGTGSPERTHYGTYRCGNLENAALPNVGR